jgi:hypothetical protein
MDVAQLSHSSLTVTHLPAVDFQGYYYKQITGDSGSGARLGDFEGESVGCKACSKRYAVARLIRYVCNSRRIYRARYYGSVLDQTPNGL